MESIISLFIAKAPDIWLRLVEHMNMTTMAVFLSILIGVPLGIAITKDKKAAAVVMGIANLMQSIPCIALLAFSVPFVGIGEKPAVIMVITYALLPIIKNTYTGIQSIGANVLEAADGIGYSKWQKLWKVELPLAMPFIMAGVRISAVAAVGNMTIAAFAGAGGLGWFINMGLISLNIETVLLGAIPACCLALFVDFILARAEYLLVPRGLHPADLDSGEDRSRKIAHFFHSAQKAAVILSCAALLLVPAGFQGMRFYREMTQKSITIGAANFTESYIMGYLFEDFIEAHTDIAVKRRFNLSGGSFCFAALKEGSIDTFVSYTGTAYMNFLNQPMSTDKEKVYQVLKKDMAEQYKIHVSKPLGFNNTYVLSVKPETAEAYGLHALSDLVMTGPSLRLGCTPEFYRRPDSLPRLEAEEGISFGSAVTLDSTIRYQALESGDVDIIDAFSTDGLLEKQGLTQLTDDLQFFPPYYAVVLTRDDTFKEYPELPALFSRLDGAITDEDMRKMNYAVDVEGRDAHAVAHEFLQAKGLI